MAHRLWQHCGQFHDYSNFALCSSICSLFALIRRHLTCRNTSLFMTLPTQCTFHQLFGSAVENADTSSNQSYWTFRSLQTNIRFYPWSTLLISAWLSFGSKDLKVTKAVAECSEKPLKLFWSTLSSRGLDGCSGSISFRRLYSADVPAQRNALLNFEQGQE